MKAINPWITYRTRFLVQAKQLNTSITFTDVFGRQHSGSKGDYLVESSDGVFRIAPRQIFEDVYVPLDGDRSAVGSGIEGACLQPRHSEPHIGTGALTPNIDSSAPSRSQPPGWNSDTSNAAVSLPKDPRKPLPGRSSFGQSSLSPTPPHL